MFQKQPIYNLSRFADGLPDTVLRTPTGRLLRALYVEDCPVQASAGSFLLQQLGIQIDVAHDGAEALTMLQSSRRRSATDVHHECVRAKSPCWMRDAWRVFLSLRYHLVIIDLVLPDMSGYAVCSAYQQCALSLSREHAPR